jgi:glutaredoxin 2
MEASKLKEDIAPRVVNCIEEMRSLIDKESEGAHCKLREKRGTIQILKTLLACNLRLPSHLDPQVHTISEEKQIAVNQLLIRHLASLQRFP